MLAEVVYFAIVLYSIGILLCICFLNMRLLLHINLINLLITSERFFEKRNGSSVLQESGFTIPHPKKSLQSMLTVTCYKR